MSCPVNDVMSSVTLSLMAFAAVLPLDEVAKVAEPNRAPERVAEVVVAEAAKKRPNYWMSPDEHQPHEDREDERGFDEHRTSIALIGVTAQCRGGPSTEAQSFHGSEPHHRVLGDGVLGRGEGGSAAVCGHPGVRETPIESTVDAARIG